MAKWISPREQRERETAKLVAQYRSTAKAATETLTADWQTVPDGASNLIYKAVRQALLDAGLPATGDVNYAAMTTLQDECAKPFTAKWHQQQREARKVAEAAVDVHRPVMARCDGAHRIGELVILRDGSTERVLVCIGTGRGWDDELGNTEWYSDLAEPTENEMATPDYQRMQADVTERNRHEAEKAAEIHNRHEAARAASLADGHEPTLFDDLFAGMDDDNE